MRLFFKLYVTKVLHYNVTIYSSSVIGTYYDLLIILFPYYFRGSCEKGSIKNMFIIPIIIVMFESDGYQQTH